VAGDTGPAPYIVIQPMSTDSATSASPAEPPPTAPAPPGPTYPTVAIDWAHLAPNPLPGGVQYTAPDQLPAIPASDASFIATPYIVIPPPSTGSALATPPAQPPSTAPGADPAPNPLPGSVPYTATPPVLPAGDIGPSGTPAIAIPPVSSASTAATAAAKPASANAFVADAFRGLLGRPAVQADLTFWGRVARRLGDPFVFDAVFHSAEHRMVASGG
jgi:hypothetical protein